jgi:hypothetical protein
MAGQRTGENPKLGVAFPEARVPFNLQFDDFELVRADGNKAESFTNFDDGTSRD